MITQTHFVKPEDFVDFDNLLDDFISLNNKLLLTDPSFMLTGSLLPSVIAISVKAISNGEKNFKSAKSGCYYLETLFRIFWPQLHIDEYNETT